MVNNNNIKSTVWKGLQTVFVSAIKIDMEVIPFALDLAISSSELDFISPNLSPTKGYSIYNRWDITDRNLF